MLTKIKSEVFAEDTIYFHEGLNVVLGDNVGSNSIGKSTLLMIVDFIFGGKSYISHNKDMIEKLGHHDFLYTFEFGNTEYFFIRGTKKSDVIYEINSDYDELNQLKVVDFTKKLKELYRLDFPFRSTISTFSRVWGKTNLNIKKPLHNHPSQKNKETVTNLLKLFNRYERIAERDKELKDLDSQKEVLNKAGKYKFIPKITKKDYNKNLKEIESLSKEVEKIGQKAYSPAININDIISDELIKVREDKNKLLEDREYFKSRLNRTNRTSRKSNVANFEELFDFFPNVNIEKLSNIESFHDRISSILTDELDKARKELQENIKDIDGKIDELNQKQEQLLNPDEEINVFVDKLIEYNTKIQNLQIENEYYSKLSVLKSEIKNKEKKLDEIKEDIVAEINTKVNQKIKQINDIIHKNKRSSPELELKFATYDYKIYDNTGTGKAYTNLLIFDLAIFNLTTLPFIIHDSFLFKNIEKEAVDQIIKYYNSMSKQVFIAIDVISMYNKETQKLLQDNKVIQLSKDKLLTNHDWR
ncbi:DUF2326 domain-containing protein [Salibacterium sp. K-3]